MSLMVGKIVGRVREVSRAQKRETWVIKKWKWILTLNVWRQFGYHLTFCRNVSCAATEVVISLVVSV